MERSDDLYQLPRDLSVPIDDSACGHLTGTRLSSITLQSTAGLAVDLAAVAGRKVVYCYPRTGRPDEEAPRGWNQIPGARGCTPQSCAFRDHFAEIKALGASVFGLSTQTTEYQREAVERLHLPFDLLSDSDLNFATVMRLPTFRVDSMILIKRLTLIIDEGRIKKVFYPVFPPDKSPDEVLSWLKYNSF
jgi:peroxiredoxin